MNKDAQLEQQTYLAIPYEKREQAMKAIGLLDNGRNALGFDAEKGLWFAKAHTPLAKVEPWLPNADLFKSPTHQDPITEFAQVLDASGFVLPEPPIFDGQKHRVSTIDDKRGQKSAVYCGYSDGHPAGWYQDHRNHGEPQKWSASFAHSNPLSQLHLKAHQANSRSLRQITEAKRYQHYAHRCSQAFQLMPSAKVHQPYLVKKDVLPFPDVMQDKKGRLVIPLMDENHKVHSLQRISGDGFKSLKKSAQKSGHFFVVGYKPLKNGEPILYAEGYSTAASIAQATNRSVVMTVDAGNMPKVAEKLKVHYPNSQHLFLADDDRNNKVNKGLDKAREAAELTQGHWLSPNFIVDEKEAGMTDFNDLHISRGLNNVKDQIEHHIERCWPELTKPKTPSFNTIEPITSNKSEPDKTKPANQKIDQQFKTLAVLTNKSAANDKAVNDETKVDKAPTAVKDTKLPPKNKTTALPDRIEQQYIALNNKYYFSSRPTCLAFIDKGNKLQTKLSHAQVISDLLSIAKQRDWNEIKITGSKNFKRQAWLQASLQSMTVRGYRPDKEDVKQLMLLQAKTNTTSKTKEKSETINEIEPVIAVVHEKSKLNRQTTIQAAKEFCKALQPEAQQSFMDKVKQKLDNLFSTPEKPQPETHLEVKAQNLHTTKIMTIEEPPHEQQLER